MKQNVCGAECACVRLCVRTDEEARDEETARNGNAQGDHHEQVEETAERNQ
jgi:hypothetical protein